MDASDQVMTRYLLGELSESEQAALEEKYFTDPRVFDQVLKAESELVDNYVRGRLSTQTRERFEQSFLIHPRRRERVKFAEALATRLDQIEGSRAVAEPPGAGVSRWQRLLLALRGRRLVLGFSMSLVFLLTAVGGIRFFIENRRLRQELAQTREAQAERARRERELQQQLTDEERRAHELAGEEARAEELAAEPVRQRARQQTIQTKQAPPARSASTFASLVLTVGGVRGIDTGQASHLVIPRGTSQVRLRLNLKENDYPGYRVSLQRVGGAEIFSRQGLKPGITKSGASFTLIVPAHKFGAAGDYVLTLRGVSQGGEIEDLSKSLFRVEKK